MDLCLFSRIATNVISKIDLSPFSNFFFSQNNVPVGHIIVPGDALKPI